MNAQIDTVLAQDSPGMAIVEAPQPAASPLDIAPEAFRNALARRGENRKALMQWVGSSLVRGVDYGKLHVVSRDKCSRGKFCDDPRHFSKDCLFKPGAEKIAGMLGVTPTFPTLHEYEKAALAGTELKQIILRCHMVDASGRIVADGIGARSLDQDYGDINKSLKMCAKSAHIDATLRMAGLSEVFTQDLDQMAVDGKLDAVEPPGYPSDVLTPEKRSDLLPKVAALIEKGDGEGLKKQVSEMNEGEQKGVWSFLSTKQKKAARELLQKATPAGAEGYAERFRKALEFGNDQTVLELHRECNAVAAFALEVSLLLTPGERERINEAVDRASH